MVCGQILKESLVPPDTPYHSGAVRDGDAQQQQMASENNIIIMKGAETLPKTARSNTTKISPNLQNTGFSTP